MQDRQEESGRLAGARLGGGQYVAAGEDGRDRLRLNGSRLDIVNFAGRFHQRGVQSKCMKWHEAPA